MRQFFPLFLPLSLLAVVSCGMEMPKGPDLSEYNPFRNESEAFAVPTPTWVDQASPLSIAYSKPIRPFFPTPSETAVNRPVAVEAGVPGRVQFIPGDSGGGLLRLIGAEAIGAEQAEDHWCWAACAQMVNQFNGNARVFPTFNDQEKIAAYFSTLEDTQESGARFATFARALVPELEAGFHASPGKVQASISVTTGDEIIEAMRIGEMPVISIANHAYAVLEVEYVLLPSGEAKKYAEKLASSDAFMNYIGFRIPDEVKRLKQTDDLIADYGIVRLEVWNPTKGQGMRTFTAEQLDLLAEDGYKIDFVISRLVAHELFKGERPQLSESLLGD